jgi:hypothetical protein
MRVSLQGSGQKKWPKIDQPSQPITRPRPWQRHLPPRNRRGPRAAGLFCCIMQLGLDDYFFTVPIVFRIRETIW